LPTALTLLLPGVEEGVKSINALVNVRTELVGACKQALTLLGPEVYQAWRKA